LWWNQRARLQKLQSAALRQIRFKGSRYQSGIFKGSPKQAICPFCFKVFYDKSTMNRHVSKRVCLGLQFPAPDFNEDTEIVSEIVPLPVKSPIRPSTPVLSGADLSPELKTSDDSVKLSSSEDSTKSNKIPCPYCKKLMKGERGVRKHIDFYGCPKAFSSDMLDNENE
jgi:hypothetical protein